MCASLFLCQLKRVVRVTSPASESLSESFAGASCIRLPDPAPRALAQPDLLSPAVRCALLRVPGEAGP